ncbi:MAG TPA: hypothetical protein VN457_05435, partial [Chlamydiales bacterium]|nr:hypothetical protein [Chlamydiales bacterium]
MKRWITCSLFGLLTCVHSLSAANQTDTVSPVHIKNHLPFNITIKLADFMLPNGLHSGATGVCDGKWLFIAGRTNGMHTFNIAPDNFPPQQQNKVVYVVDPKTQKVYSRSLTQKKSGLTQSQIDYLSVTAPQFYQSGDTLYMTGGYGVNSATGLFTTKPILTAIDMKGLIAWVKHETSHKASHFIRQISKSIFKVTGGYMTQIAKGPTLLVFGQSF